VGRSDEGRTTSSSVRGSDGPPSHKPGQHQERSSRCSSCSRGQAGERNPPEPSITLAWTEVPHALYRCRCEQARAGGLSRDEHDRRGGVVRFMVATSCTTPVEERVRAHIFLCLVFRRLESGNFSLKRNC